MSNYIFITGGVVSTLGKGITSSSIAALLQAHNFTVKLKKLDPYLNVDPGTMNPKQHGEVYITSDGLETDLDLGHYERFTGLETTSTNTISSGKIYQNLLEKERKGDYLGETVQVIPHVTDLIKEFIHNHNNEDFILCEIGGTVGDIEALPFFEAIRQVSYELQGKVMYIHLTLVPYLQSSRMLKTKPTQHSIKELRALGIQADMIICRSEYKLSDSEIEKIALFSNLKKERIIPAIDLNSIYKVPLEYKKHRLDKEILEHFGKESNENKEIFSKWKNIEELIDRKKTKVIKIALIAKYESEEESYKSVIESLFHASLYNDCKVEIIWINVKNISENKIEQQLFNIDGILIPGGFGYDGVESKIIAIKFARENNIPFFGICFGMQLALLEFARNKLAIENATSEEFLDDFTNKNYDNDNILIRTIESGNSNIGGSMRVGNYKVKISSKDSLLYEIYNKSMIIERHRHRYELPINLKELLEKEKLKFTSYSGNILESFEIEGHPFYIAVQFHPEFTSTVFKPNPIFNKFLEVMINIKNCKK